MYYFECEKCFKLNTKIKLKLFLKIRHSFEKLPISSNFICFKGIGLKIISLPN